MNTTEPLGQFEERLLAELKTVVAAQSPPRQAPGRAPAARPGRAPAWKLRAGMAIGLSGALAAGLLFATTGRPQNGSHYTLAADFLNRAATAALAQNAGSPRPGQVYYVEELQVIEGLGKRWFPAPVCVVLWNLTPLTGEDQPIPANSAGCPAGTPVPPAGRPTTNIKPGALLPWYPAIDSLPADPAALLARLRSDADPAGPYGYLGATRDEIVYQLLGNLLESPVPGTLRAGLYRVIETLPGVTLVTDAVDASGRHGTGIRLTLVGADDLPWTTEFILQPGTYQFLGWITDGYTNQYKGGGRPHEVLISVADLTSGLVPAS